MLTSLFKLFRKSPPPSPIHDDALGKIDFNTDERVWQTTTGSDGDRWRICIAGKSRPDERLLHHARDIARRPDIFHSMVTEFLRSESSQFPGAESEVLSLRVESLNLFWPDRAEDGMIFFEGGHEGRVWRCDYVNRKPSALGFDG
jgi:hypothetical protein